VACPSWWTLSALDKCLVVRALVLLDWLALLRCQICWHCRLCLSCHLRWHCHLCYQLCWCSDCTAALLAGSAALALLLFLELSSLLGLPPLQCHRPAATFAVAAAAPLLPSLLLSVTPMLLCRRCLICWRCHLCTCCHLCQCCRLCCRLCWCCCCTAATFAGSAMLAVPPLLELLFAGASAFAGPAAPVAIDALAAVLFHCRLPCHNCCTAAA
jgi:hypothetical protein